MTSSLLFHRIAAQRDDSAYQALADRLKRKAPEPEVTTTKARKKA